MNRRRYGFPLEADVPFYLFDDDMPLKSHPAYREAKAGNQEAATDIVADLAQKFVTEIGPKLPKDAIFSSPFAAEATGDNAIPQVLSVACASVAGGVAEEDIVQITRVFHTGEDPMERLAMRPKFEGLVQEGAIYVLVDDVTTMGGTLAELSDYIRKGGGVVKGAVLLVNAGRLKQLVPDKRMLKKLKERYPNEIAELFGIEVDALTANEAEYLIGFRTIDEIRNRLAKAQKETDIRLRSKRIK